MVSGDPAGLRQAEYDRAIESVRRAEVEIFHGGLLAQLGRLEPQRQTAAVPRFGFAIDQQAESLVEAQVQVLVRFELLAQPEHHAEQAQRIELVEGLCQQHALASIKLCW